MKKIKYIIIMTILILTNIHSQNIPVPFELAGIILEEKPLQNSIWNRNLTQMNYSISKITTDWKTLKSKISAFADTKIIVELDKKVRNLTKYSQEEKYNKINNEFLAIQEDLYYLYKMFKLNTLPELNFLLIDIEQIKDYLNEKRFDLIIMELKEIENFMRITEIEFNNKNLFKGRTKLLFKYFRFLINKTIPASNDEDIKTINNSIAEFYSLLSYFKKLYKNRPK